MEREKRENRKRREKKERRIEREEWKTNPCSFQDKPFDFLIHVAE